MPTHKINVQSLTASVGESQVVDSTTVWYLSITKSRKTRPIIVTWHQFLLVMRHISNEFFMLILAGLPHGEHDS